MTGCAAVDEQARAVVDAGDVDAAAALLVEHAADTGPGDLHHRILLKARLDAFAADLFNLPPSKVFARRAAVKHLNTLTEH